MLHPPVVHRVVAKLARSEIGGVNAHTLPIALDRAERENIDFEPLNERQMAVLLLERASYPETTHEFNLFLTVQHTFTPGILNVQEITDNHAAPYMRWAAAFLNDPEPIAQKNARLLLRWLVANRREAVAADQTSLDNLRRVAADPDSGWKNSAFIVYALGMCGTLEDYDQVIRHSEQVIEHDRENLELVAEALHRLYPPALINALQYFLEHTSTAPKQFIAGMHLLAKVAEIDDPAFWKTYYNDMDRILTELSEVADHIPAVERVLDLIDKQLALASRDDE